MATIRLPYTVKRRGRLFWQPPADARDMGLPPRALGQDTPSARAEALRLYDEYRKLRGDQEKVSSYPPGTFGSFYDQFKRTHKWREKSPRTQEDYARAWVHIDAWRPHPKAPTLARTVVTKINTDLVEDFYAWCAGHLSASERYRTIKCLKVLLDDMVARLRLPYVSPSSKLANPQPRGRSAIWLAAEVAMLAAKAKELGYEGMSLGIRLAWETMFSPVDIWTLAHGELKQDATGWYIERARVKTDKPAFAALSDELAADLVAYIKDQPFEYAPATPILRQRNGKAYRSKDTFGDDFRAARKALWPDETRQLIDIRRSANVEADLAGADKKTMGELLANTMADNRFLDETYTPPTVAKAREVMVQRRKGRAKLATEMARVRSKSVEKAQ